MGSGNHTYRALMLATLCCAGNLAHAQVQDYVQAGIVKVVSGNVQLLRREQPSVARVGDRVFSGDRVVTAEGAAIGITLRDDTLLSLGPKSNFLLEQYSFDTSSGEGNVAVRVVKGTLRYVTGLIGKHAPERQQVLTPTATIGIRGTDFIVDVADE
jgi:hypothetical protein